jgi:exonuclease SbcC
MHYDADAHQRALLLARRAPELQQKLSAAEQAAAAAIEVERTLAELTLTISRLSAEEKDREGDAVQASYLGEEVREQADRVHDTRAQVEALTHRRQELQAELVRLEERLAVAREAEAEAAQCANAIEEALYRLRVLRALGQAFGKTGIPALLIDRAIPELQDEANAVLADLADGRLTLAFRTLREKRSDRQLAETLEIVVGDERGERGYEDYSGGECMRVDLALRIGLSTFLAHRAGARVELCVLDETAAALDAEGRQLFIEMLRRIAGRFASVLVISHVSDLIEALDTSIRITKDAEGSHVEVSTR